MKAQLHYPVPVDDVGRERIGAGAGLSLINMVEDNAGVGLDVIYHYWPASSAYTAAFERFLRSNRNQTLAGSDWAFTALQVTVHGRYSLPVSPRMSSRVQIGFGAYRLDWNLDHRTSADTYAWVIGPIMRNVRTVPGGYAGLGFDLRVSPGIALGIDGTWHALLSEKDGWASGADLPNFSALTAGAHVQVAWGRRTR